ncbi:structural cement protein Gp24 [Rodentibacter ratti]|uniref:DUF2190 domain-containing protein n=1 Tax=Rodentibacter ratti TaxID=1906745 RepID=A0A1V3L5A4_9PAST|nr:DUF2190 family protein [Rodentibacter ratti]OOF85127.1 hypothetical protein BKG88_09200 [Rodentibacter ratti]
MSQVYDNHLPSAFAGMKADARYDLVESFAAEGDIPFGAIVTKGTSATQVKLGGEKALGIALHSHAVVGNYVQFDSVSVLRQGAAWCVVKEGATITAGEAVKFDPATGQVSNAGIELPNATFKTGAVDCGKFGKLAIVEIL